jgi:hypothetical protein
MTEFTRQQLYAAIWSKPTVQLAKEIGVSDVAVAKACKRHDIPKPSLGYWARVRHGHRVKRLPLPKLDDPSRQAIRFQPVADHRRSNWPSDETTERIRMEKMDANKIVVAEKLEVPHPLVERTMRGLISAVPDKDGIVMPKAKNCLLVAVGKESIDRAMRIMNALINAVSSRAVKVWADDEHMWSTLMTVDGETIAMRLSESLGSRRRELTPTQKRQNQLFSIHKETEKYPRGLLSLSARGDEDTYVQHRWSELDGKRLEDRLNAVVAWLYVGVQNIKRRRLEFAERDRLWAEEARLREEAEERHRRYVRRLRNLKRMRRHGGVQIDCVSMSMPPSGPPRLTAAVSQRAASFTGRSNGRAGRLTGLIL